MGIASSFFQPDMIELAKAEYERIASLKLYDTDDEIINHLKHFVEIQILIKEGKNCSLNSSNISSEQFFNAIEENQEVSSSFYGRVDRVQVANEIRNIPNFLTTRPLKKPDFEMPFSFVMSPKLLNRIPICVSIEDILLSIISLESAVVKDRIDLTLKGQLDHVLMIFSSTNVPVKPASIQGISELLHFVHPEAAIRFDKLLPQLYSLAGSENFHARLNKFADYWDLWHEVSQCQWFGNHKNYPLCNCKHIGFNEFCLKFDEVSDDLEKSLFVVREMMYILLSCNRYFGMDGIVYDQNGNAVGEEFLAINESLVGEINTNNNVACKFLSDIVRFREKIL